MKKILLAFCTMALFACSSDDDAPEPTTFDTPVWLRGTWGYEPSEISGEIPVYHITPNDICEYEPTGIAVTCWMEYLESQGIPYHILNKMDGENYSVGYSNENTIKTRNFQPVSDTEIIVMSIDKPNEHLYKLD